jgi:hypothetical protein
MRTFQFGRMQWAGYVERMGGRRNAYRTAVHKLALKKSLGKSGDITIDFEGIGCMWTGLI